MRQARDPANRQFQIIYIFLDNKSIKKLGTFFGQAGNKIKNKTDKKTKLLSKNIRKKTIKKEYKKLNLVLNFFQRAAPRIKQEKNQKLANFSQKLSKKHDVRHDASIIQNEETLIHQNETVQNILDNIDKNPTDQTKKNLDALKFQKRKKYAEQQFNDPDSHLRSQQFIKKMQQNRQELESIKQANRHFLNQKLEESMETIKKNREDFNERLLWEKRQTIAQRIQDERERRQLQRQINMQSNKLIKALKHEQQEEMEIKKQILEEQRQMELEKQKKLLAQKKSQHSPISLQQLKNHAKKHQEDLQLLKLEKEREKIEKQLEFERNHVKVQRSVFTGVIEEEQKKIRNQLEEDKNKKKALLQRKLKYAEVVKDMFQPQVVQKEQVTKQEQEKELLDLSQQDYYNFEEFVKLKSHTKNIDSKEEVQKLNKHLSQAQFRGYISGMDNIKQIEKRFNSTKNQSANKFEKKPLTKLQQKEKDDEIKSRYSHIQKLPKIQYPHYQRPENASPEKTEQVETSQVTLSQKINYLKDLHQQRKEYIKKYGQQEDDWKKILNDDKKMQKKDNRELVKNKIQKMENKAQIKEKLGYLTKDYDEEAEANNLYVQSIKAKLELLKSYES